MQVIMLLLLLLMMMVIMMMMKRRRRRMMIIIIAVISIASYLTDRREHVTLYQISTNVYIKTWAPLPGPKKPDGFCGRIAALNRES